MPSSAQLASRPPIPKLGCGYAVCAMLALIGGAILFAAEAKWKKGQKTEAWIVGGMGSVLCLTAAGLIAPMQRSVVRAKERRRREEARPDEPWTWDSGWIDRRGIPQSGRRNGAAFLFMGAMALLVSLPATFAIPKELGRGNFGILAVLLFPTIGISFLSIAAVDKLRRRKYGLARFVAEAVPISFGGELVGMIIVNRPVVPTGVGRISLDCHRTTLTRHGNKRRQRDEVVSHTERGISPADWAAAAFESRVFVQLPIRSGMPTSTTQLDVNHPTYEWRLRVQVPTAGADFVAEFVLPVFDVAHPTAARAPQE